MMKRITVFMILFCSCFVNIGCRSTLAVDGEHFDYNFCGGGISGHYRILVPIDGEEFPVLALFPFGGPYDKDHVRCAISGDHVIMDMGKGAGL